MFLRAYKGALAVIAKKPIMLWGLSLLSVIITFFATIFTTPIFCIGFLVSILVNCGMAKVYIDGLCGKEVNSDQLFAAFNGSCLRVVGGMLWRTLWIFIWMLVPIVGPIVAIVKSYSYSFVPYILMTKPEVTATQALRLSMQMTRGRKGSMFLADLCFGGGVVIISAVLALFAQIPIIGVLFGLVLALFIIAVALFATIFQGLYWAYFYMDAQRPRRVYQEPQYIEEEEYYED